MSGIERRADRAIASVSNKGEGLSLRDWLEYLQTVLDHLNSLITAAEEDLRREEGDVDRYSQG